MTPAAKWLAKTPEGNAYEALKACYGPLCVGGLPTDDTVARFAWSYRVYKSFLETQGFLGNIPEHCYLTWCCGTEVYEPAPHLVQVETLKRAGL